MKFFKTISISILITLLLLTGCVQDNTSDPGSSAPVPVSSALPSSEIIPLEGEESSEAGEDDIVTDVLEPASIIEEEDRLKAPEIFPDEHDLNNLSNSQVTWGPGHERDNLNRPVAPVGLQETYAEFGSYFIGPQEKQIYLTFDEGYESGLTEKLLDTLKEKGVSAVFFVTMDYALYSPDMLDRMIGEGHIVGNHTKKHPNMTEISDERAEDEIMGLHEHLLTNHNYEMWLFRPPQGAFSERSLAFAHAMGYLNIFWSFAYQDWYVDNQPDPSSALEKLCSALHPGAIYLLHTSSTTNAAILGDFIDNARAQGYEFAPFALPDPSNDGAI